MRGIRSKALQLGKGPLKTTQQMIEHTSHASEFIILIFDREDVSCRFFALMLSALSVISSSGLSALRAIPVSSKSCPYQCDGQTE